MKIHQVNTTNDLKNSSFVFRDQLNVEEKKEKKACFKATENVTIL